MVLRMDYNDLVDYAECILGIIHNRYKGGNKLAYQPFLLGIGGCKVSIGSEHNYQAVIDAIHNYYTLDNSVKDGYYESLVWLISKINDSKTADKVLSILSYEIYLRKNNKNSFDIPINDLVDKFSEVVVSNEIFTEEYIRGILS